MVELCRADGHPVIVAPVVRRCPGYSQPVAIGKGDKVTWNTSQGKTTGTAVEKMTSDFTFKGQDFKPTDDHPFWIVESEKSGSQAAHKESALDPA